MNITNLNYLDDITEKSIILGGQGGASGAFEDIFEQFKSLTGQTVGTLSGKFNVSASSPTGTATTSLDVTPFGDAIGRVRLGFTTQTIAFATTPGT